MNKRSIQLTLEEAKKLYNEGDSNMKSLILSSFTEDELRTYDYRNIKTFEDAVRAVFDNDEVYINLQAFDDSKSIAYHIKAIYRLDIIRKALNGDWKPSMLKGHVYYPFVRFYTTGDSYAKEVARRNNNWKIYDKALKVNGKAYSLVGGDCSHSFGTMGIFGSGSGNVRPFLGMLGCKSREIAEHMSKYFAKEIFEATYGYHMESYKWV